MAMHTLPAENEVWELGRQEEVLFQDIYNSDIDLCWPATQN